MTARLPISEKVRKARKVETFRRHARAQARARGELVRRHRDEYLALKALHLAQIHAERGPLPGDE